MEKHFSYDEGARDAEMLMEYLNECEYPFELAGGFVETPLDAVHTIGRLLYDHRDDVDADLQDALRGALSKFD
ncbi:MAG: hypothetical protein ACRDHZ_00085 [Ktedonobacteraceae bacterium]